jgi:hypothetical protein
MVISAQLQVFHQPVVQRIVFIIWFISKESKSYLQVQEQLLGVHRRQIAVRVLGVK